VNFGLSDSDPACRRVGQDRQFGQLHQPWTIFANAVQRGHRVAAAHAGSRSRIRQSADIGAPGRAEASGGERLLIAVEDLLPGQAGPAVGIALRTMDGFPMSGEMVRENASRPAVLHAAETGRLKVALHADHVDLARHFACRCLGCSESLASCGS
jgi:hypothetical protein